jgi:uracil-DNA glycosylase
MGSAVPITTPSRYRVLITVHPSSLLRVPSAQREASYLAFVKDLRHASNLYRRPAGGSP